LDWSTGERIYLAESMNTSSGNLQRRKAKKAKSKKGGEFYTPRCLTKLIVEAIDVKGGRIF